VRPSYGSILVPLFEEDDLRMSELARRARLSKQTMTTMIRLLERDGLVIRRPDPTDGRASLISLTQRGRRLEPVATGILADLRALADRRLGAEAAANTQIALKELLDL
jgi:DNA-binding MarR family transcriptional regulator